MGFKTNRIFIFCDFHFWIISRDEHSFKGLQIYICSFCMCTDGLTKFLDLLLRYLGKTL